MNNNVEIISENLTPTQVLEIRLEAKREGCTVNVQRWSASLVEIRITRPDRVIDISNGGYSVKPARLVAARGGLFHG